MPLLSLWEVDKSAVLEMNIEQIVSIAGSGKLLDNSICQEEIRHFLSEVPTEMLERYANYCLENSFNKSGQVLQDIVNELGRRLEYFVINGKYQGVRNAIGFDGLWKDESEYHIVVEVKTTDAYRLSLDVVSNYRKCLIDRGDITVNSSVLIVVGRSDTGELEAQVRGSKHAWDIRIISVDSLINLVNIKESADNQETIYRIKTLLRPIEYTRIDMLVDIMFTTAKDLENSLDQEEEQESDSLKSQKDNLSSINGLRNQIISEMGDKTGKKLVSIFVRNLVQFYHEKHSYSGYFL